MSNVRAFARKVMYNVEFKPKCSGLLLVVRAIYACRNSSRFTSLD